MQNFCCCCIACTHSTQSWILAITVLCPEPIWGKTNMPSFACISLKEEIVCVSFGVESLLFHSNFQAPRGSPCRCKPDRGPSVSSGMNNSPRSAQCATASGRLMIKQTAGLLLMFLSGLSLMIFLLNHLFPQCLHHSRNCLISVTVQCHLLIKAYTLHINVCSYCQSHSS